MPEIDARFAAAMANVFAPAATLGVPARDVLGLFDPALDDGIDVGAHLNESLASIRVLRTRDLVDVTFRFSGLALRVDERGGRFLVRRGRAAAFLIADFGPQHLYEQAFFEAGGDASDFLKNPLAQQRAGVPPTSGTPARDVLSKAILARSSRLVFTVTGQRIPYSSAGLLAAMRVLPLSVVPHASPPPIILDWREVSGVVSVVRPDRLTAIDRAIAGVRLAHTADIVQARFGTASAVSAVFDDLSPIDWYTPSIELRPPSPRPPEQTETAIELPWRLQLSPHSRGAFAHSLDEVEHDERVELWHTRLGTRIGQVDEAAAVEASEAIPAPVNESDPGARTVRAIWTRDYDRATDAADESRAKKIAVDAAADLANPQPFRGSLSPRDRRQLVHLTSDFRWPKSTGEDRWEPRAFRADALMLTSLGGWLSGTMQIPGAVPAGLSIEEWTHRATMARDQYVKVVYQGVLLPFGHRAALVKVTERLLRDGVARLIQRLFVIVKQPERSFRASGVPALDHRMPFGWVRIVTPGTPPLALPSQIAGVVGGSAFVPSIPTADAVGAGGDPPTGTAPFRFRMVASDVEHGLVEFEGPLVFVEKTVLDQSAGATAAASLAALNGAVPTFDLRGQRIAYAPHGDPDDTTLSTASARFVSEPDPGTAERYTNFVLPRLQVTNAVVPAMSAFTGQNGPVPLRYPQVFADHGLDTAGRNRGELFLEVSNASGGTATAPKPMDFAKQSDRSGGFLAPSVAINSLARRLGPVGGAVAALDQNPAGFDAGSMFPPDMAKLFGILSLRDLLPDAGSPLPKFATQAVDTVVTIQTAIVRLQQLDPVAALAGQAQAIQDAAGSLVDRIEALADAVAALGADPAASPDLDGILGDLGAAARTLADGWNGFAPSLGLPRAHVEQLEGVIRKLSDLSDDVTAVAKAVEAFFRGELLPQSIDARLEWSTELTAWPPGASVFEPKGDRTLRLVAETSAPLRPGGTPTALVSCSLPPFELRLVGPDAVILIRFEVMEFSMQAGRKPDVNVVLGDEKGIEFAGALKFVETLKDIIPFDGFSDPPYLDVSPSGLTAGFDLAIPDLAVGIFALTNITFGAEISVPFIGESLEFRFFFATREDPFRLQVAFFAGGGFLAITLTPKGMRVIEAAFEFGAQVALSFVVASGSVSVMAGIYFRLEVIDDDNQSVTLTGYFRARGEVDVLGLISASIEIYLELTYKEVTAGGQKQSKAYGKASITIEVSVCFLSFSVTASCEKQFSGSKGDPTFADMLGGYVDAQQVTRDPWAEYCDAFAVEPA
ncbi:hypothetical protein ET445_00320 [Agromyces protaetiae]|uniref:Uncharacterized protein n=1 Tax=Agromyces protaetiae TaxID=2509455 RepID=A0A4P6FAM7_9MICO|nr:hypothetical protein [Agromyces protaetiae]QAY72003.1 hypothetical protein ET445_00320 [Agromyces protaetiae]